MTVLFVVIPIALVLAAAATAAFIWVARSGQLDDLESPGYRVLFDDDEAKRPGA